VSASTARLATQFERIHVLIPPLQFFTDPHRQLEETRDFVWMFTSTAPHSLAAFQA
jgi:hypothetical protein